MPAEIPRKQPRIVSQGVVPSDRSNHPPTTAGRTNSIPIAEIREAHCNPTPSGDTGGSGGLKKISMVRDRRSIRSRNSRNFRLKNHARSRIVLKLDPGEQ